MSYSPTASAIPAICLLLAGALTGCSASSAEAEPAPTVTVTADAAASLPPGAEDVWDLGLSGNMIEDLSEEMDIDGLTGEDGVFTATQFFANEVTDVCRSDTERPHPALESDLERNVRLAMTSDRVDDGENYVRILSSYGCPDLQDEVDTAITKAS